MNFAERIQKLRKGRGISQEELAEQLGVSRQAVGKYESGQSTPDIERILLLSEFFGVTTDYLLKGTESEPVQGSVPNVQKKREKAGVLSVVATAMNFTGLILAVTIWHELQRAVAVAVGLVFMALGCMIYAVGMVEEKEEAKVKAKRSFWRKNIWLLSFIPLSLAHNILGGSWITAPYPIPVNSYWWVRLGLFWLIYMGLGLLVMYRMREPR